jgi:hypothetical protein
VSAAEALCQCCGNPGGQCRRCGAMHNPAIEDGKCIACNNLDPILAGLAKAGLDVRGDAPARPLHEAQAMKVPEAVRKATGPSTPSGGPLAYERRLVEGEIGRALNRRYAIKLDRLDLESLRELRRLIRDLVDDGHSRERRAQQPWRK